MEGKPSGITKKNLPQLRAFYKRLSFPPALADVFFSRNADGNFVVWVDEEIVGHICMSYFFPFRLNIMLGRCGVWGMHVPSSCVRFLRKMHILSRYEVSNIIVLPGFRGKGYGDMLLSAGIQEACDRGEKELFLIVAKTNAVAISFYENKGFRIFSSWNNVKDVMCKELL